MTEPNNIPSNSFTTLLPQIRKGESLVELSEALADLVEAVTTHQKAGKLIYEIKVSPSGNALSVSDEIKIKCPTESRKASIFFPNENGTLTRNDPNQKEFNELRELEKSEVQVKDINRKSA